MLQSFREFKSFEKMPEAAVSVDSGGNWDGKGTKNDNILFYLLPSRRCGLFFHAFYIRKPNILPIPIVVSRKACIFYMYMCSY